VHSRRHLRVGSDPRRSGCLQGGRRFVSQWLIDTFGLHYLLLRQWSLWFLLVDEVPE